jgi:hypothetical protein
MGFSQVDAYRVYARGALHFIRERELRIWCVGKRNSSLALSMAWEWVLRMTLGQIHYLFADELMGQYVCSLV